MVEKIIIEIGEDSNGNEMYYVCSNCYSMRQDTSRISNSQDHKWFKIDDDPEAFTRMMKPNGSISHGICYTCAKKYHPDFFD